jgi:drug/metabolite transporter (DMT)-like permease
MAAVQIVLISRYAPGADAMRLAFVQLGVVSLLAAGAIPLVGETLPRLTSSFVITSLALGVLGTALALGAMNWAQQTISATRATLIYALEPVWAGLFGAIAGEPMTPNIIGGSSLIVLGVMVSELRWARLDPDATMELSAAERGSLLDPVASTGRPESGGTTRATAD